MVVFFLYLWVVNNNRQWDCLHSVYLYNVVSKLTGQSLGLERWKMDLQLYVRRVNKCFWLESTLNKL